MKFTNRILNVLASITRKLVYHRKLNQLYKHFNRLFLALGAEPKVIAEMQDGTKIEVDLSTKTERVSYYTGKYDPDLIQIIHSLLDTNSTFLDIGGNIGYYSVSISNYIKQKNGLGKVVSFEPFEGNFKRLSKNLKTNNLNKFCEVNQYGLSDKSSETEITLREDFKHGSSTGNAAIKTSKEMDAGFEVSPIKLEILDDVWSKNYSNFSKIDIIKMDIEGHEDFCLEGGQKTINQHRPTILMEVNKPYYEARNIKLNERFLPLFPENYNIYMQKGQKWELIKSLNECATLDNVFLVPVEKLNLSAYNFFIN